CEMRSLSPVFQQPAGAPGPWGTVYPTPVFPDNRGNPPLPSSLGCWQTVSKSGGESNVESNFERAGVAVCGYRHNTTSREYEAEGCSAGGTGSRQNPGKCPARHG